MDVASANISHEQTQSNQVKLYFPMISFQSINWKITIEYVYLKKK